jgi:hypothetical protein
MSFSVPIVDAARRRRGRDAEETNDEVILGTMDLNVGRCAPSQRLYPDFESPL